jgi:hypothetical protein
MSLDFEFDNYIEFTDFIKNVDFAMRKWFLIQEKFVTINCKYICYYQTQIVNKFDE